MRMTSIVAVIDQPTLDAMREAELDMPDPSPELRQLMERNGWTDESLLAGAILREALRSWGIEATP